MPHLPESDAPPYSVGSLYVVHHGWIQRWLARKLGNVSDAAELAHDVFLRLLGHLILLGLPPRPRLTPNKKPRQGAA